MDELPGYRKENQKVMGKALTMGKDEEVASQAKRRARIGIKLKLLGVLLPIVIGVIVLIMTQVYANTRKIVLEKSESVLTTNTKSIINEAKVWVKETLATLEMQRDTIEFYDMDEEQMLKYVKHTANQFDSYPSGIYAATTEGKLIHASFVPGPDYDVSERSWYQDGLKSEEFVLGSTYLDEDTHSYIVGAYGMLRGKDGKVRGVASADIYLSAIADIVKEVKIEETGRMFLLDTSSRMIIGHSDEEMIGKKLDELEDEFYSYVDGRINGNKTGLGEYEGQGNQRIYADIEQIPDSGWMTVAYVPQKEILAELEQLTSRIIVIAVFGCIFLALLMERIIHIIVKPVKKLSQTIAFITDGDFTVEVPVKTSDEIGFMADGVRKFIETMRDIIRKIGNVSETLNLQAEDSRIMSEELSQAAGSQAISMKEMNHTIEELTKSVAEVAENAASLASLVSDAKQKGDIAGEQMQEAVSASDNGKEDIAHVIDSMSLISQKMDSLESCTHQMGGSIEKINSIVVLIGEIAEETNLLSLNASIESARAGEAGKGFAVVADQIGKLATTSKESVEEIAALTKEIGSIVEKTVEETQESVEAIKNSSKVVRITGQTFDRIYQSVNKTNQAVTEMVNHIRGVNDIAVSVAGITQEQTAASEEILGFAETVTESTEKVSENSKDVENSAENMDASAKLLGKELGRFQV